MPDLLIELLTEEIPARMQKAAADDLRRLVTEKLRGGGLDFATAESHVTPRRLALSVTGLPLAQDNVSEERRGPRVGAPPPAIEGFLKSAGLATLAECEERDTGRGHFYFAIINRPGRPTAEVLPDLLRAALLELPWPKSMRFPAASFRWVRPIVSLVALFDGDILPLKLDAIPVGDATRGHRFLSPGPIHVQDFADYRDKLRAAHVVLDAEERRSLIGNGLEAAAQKLGVRVKPDVGLLDEVTGLVEWPVVLAGRIDDEFMDLPPEVLTTSMRTHQKYFACLRDDGTLAPNFLVVANITASDGGTAIVAGNERVLRARLSDARFFWDQDRKLMLAARVPKLAERVFHAKLGSVLDKVGRVMRLVEAIVPYVKSADARQALRAAELAKADLSTGMVGEFPELQGVMGRYYARHDGEPAVVADAIADHYSPLGPNDRCPTAPVSVAVALADKIDTLVGFFAIGETPTGSKDPFALRRAALGVIRIILENGLRLPLAKLFGAAFAIAGSSGKDPTADLLAFFADRLKVHLRERGVRHDLVAAIFAVGHEDDLVRLLARVEALAAFLATADGANLLVAYRRAANIVRIESRKDGDITGAVAVDQLVEAAENALHAKLEEAQRSGATALAREDFSGAMGALAALRAPVDEFFEKVTVNSDNATLRANRLRLLARIRDTVNRVADFSLIEG
jgi:glycyl-tRNA synthetase beta chain